VNISKQIMFSGVLKFEDTLQLVLNLGITHIIDCTNIPNPKKFDGIKYLQIPINDGETEKIEKYFDTVIKFVKEAKDSDGKVLIYCSAGVSRSPTLAIISLMTLENISLKESYHHINNIRPIISPNTGFWRQMINYEMTLKNGESTVSMLKGMKKAVPSVYLQRQRTKAVEISKKFDINKDKVDEVLLKEVYQNISKEDSYNKKKIKYLEYYHFLEDYLWMSFNEKTYSHEYLMLIVIIFTEKYKSRSDVWKCVKDYPDNFNFFFKCILKRLLEHGETKNLFKKVYLIGLLDAFMQSLEIEVIKENVVPVCNILMLSNISKKQRDVYFGNNIKIRKFYNKSVFDFEKKSDEEKEEAKFYFNFYWELLKRFCNILKDFEENDYTEESIYRLKYMEKCLEFFIDIESQLTTRRFFNCLLKASHLIAFCQLSELITTDVGTNFSKLVGKLIYYSNFEIDEIYGKSLTLSEVEKEHYKKIGELQKACLKVANEELHDFYCLNVSAIDNRNVIKKLASQVSGETLANLMEHLGLINEEEMSKLTFPQLIEILILHSERHINQRDQVNDQPLFPSEELIWDEELIPYDNYKGDEILPLDKLNLKFLTLNDYLIRNFNLFKLESTFEIRQEIEETLRRMMPVLVYENLKSKTEFYGQSNKGLQILSSKIVQIDKPKVGEKVPSIVKGEIQYVLPDNYSNINKKKEWDSIRKHDVCFLVTVKAKFDREICLRNESGDVISNDEFREKLFAFFSKNNNFFDMMEVVNVRGCEVECFIDKYGEPIEDYEFEDNAKKFDGLKRIMRVIFDSNQFQKDYIKRVNNKVDSDIYSSFNVIIKRESKSNNFKGVLETIRQLLNTECVVPTWLEDLLLGYGDPSSAHYKEIGTANATLNFNDTFLDKDHVIESFPNNEVFFSEDIKYNGPFKITFNDLKLKYDENCKNSTSISVENGPSDKCVLKNDMNKKNKIRFTPSQIEAIKSGMEPGLTMIVGPPGTGKTDIAVQIILNLYHNYPDQRMLIVTKSNQALNQMFEKLILLDINVKHLLRLGHGEEALQTEEDFTRYGRVNYAENMRNILLGKVKFIKDSLKIEGDYEYSCETAAQFFKIILSKMWRKFIVESKESTNIYESFPFKEYFEKLEKDDNIYPSTFNFDIASAVWKNISDIFMELSKYRSLELLKNKKDQSEYLLTKEAKIVAMTCTHAALKRKDLVELGFTYDNILMEESAQILEVETFIPLLLQDPINNSNRLKRWIMIGDHNQLPPIIQNITFQKYSNMEQSLFTRFVRLGVPIIYLDKQGRTRDEILQLYSWRYPNLTSLPHVQNNNQFKVNNPGFVHNFQFIDVPDTNGNGEICPKPYFYQNIAEAEYSVTLFKYLRLLGYPAEKITILTTYNGQAHLIREIWRRRCGDSKFYGSPNKIATVDVFQGQQNDYIILSLVRTENVGYLRDVRRFIVAMSRARLGLYVFGKFSLFEQCIELNPIMNVFKTKPMSLEIYENEMYSSENETESDISMNKKIIQNVDEFRSFVDKWYREKISSKNNS
uniref:Protein-tyrosine-phosphatase n=1 Tax=Strongyloides stercoralis TaxID=6248 RepID=A0AAF5HZ24_STRER